MDFTPLVGMQVNEMVERFERYSSNLFTETFPQKRITCYERDKPWYNEELRKLKRCRMREYNRHGKSVKYFELLNLYTEKSAIAINKFKDKLLARQQKVCSHLAAFS